MLIALSTIFFFSITINTSNIKQPNIAGTFYPKKPEDLQNEILRLKNQANAQLKIQNLSPSKIALVPHAGINYSGLAQAAIYNHIKKTANPKKIIILAPSHFQSFDYIATSSAQQFSIPTGKLNNATSQITPMLKSEIFKINNQAFENEHSMEIQLPFINFFFPKAEIIPLIVGQVSEKTMLSAAKTILQLLEKNCFLITTTDLIHHGPNYNYNIFSDNISEKVRLYEAEVINKIIKQDYQGFLQSTQKHQANLCGANPVKIMLKTLGLMKKKLHSELGCYYTSNHSNQLKNTKNIQKSIIVPEEKENQNSVGYVGIIFHEKANKKKSADVHSSLNDFEKYHLLEVAEKSLDKHFSSNPIFKKLAMPEFFTKNLMQNYGVFSTLEKNNNKLRGCIGFISTKEPLIKSAAQTTKLAAFSDSRFPPLTKDEWPLNLSLTILGDPFLVQKKNLAQKFVLGKHGISISHKNKSSIFLPKVPVEQGWSLDQTLEQLRLKAGMTKEEFLDIRINLIEGYNF